jgi:hypothetical protein
MPKLSRDCLPMNSMSRRPNALRKLGILLYCYYFADGFCYGYFCFLGTIWYNGANHDFPLDDLQLKLREMMSPDFGLALVQQLLVVADVLFRDADVEKQVFGARIFSHCAALPAMSQYQFTDRIREDSLEPRVLVSLGSVIVNSVKVAACPGSMVLGFWKLAGIAPGNERDQIVPAAESTATFRENGETASIGLLVNLITARMNEFDIVGQLQGLLFQKPVQFPDLDLGKKLFTKTTPQDVRELAIALMGSLLQGTYSPQAVQILKFVADSSWQLQTEFIPSIVESLIKLFADHKGIYSLAN